MMEGKKDDRTDHFGRYSFLVTNLEVIALLIMSGLSRGVNVSYGDDGLYGRAPKRARMSLDKAAAAAEAKAESATKSQFKGRRDITLVQPEADIAWRSNVVRSAGPTDRRWRPRLG
jgi:hypothetical protein